MNVLPDPRALHALAHSVATQGVEIRARAATLARAAAATGWHGPAAAVFAERAEHAAGALHRAADRLDDAARTLHRHAAVVEQRLHALRTLAAGAERAIDDITSGAAQLVGL